MVKKAFQKINSCNIYYEIYTQDFPTETLVMLHEGLGSVAQWKNLPQTIFDTTKLNILVYDRSGYGRSDAVPTNYPLDYLRYEARDVLPRLLEALNIEKCHLLGHSDGGSIALLFGAFYPERTIKIITEAAHVIIEDISRQGIRKIKENYPEKLQNALQRYHGDKSHWVFYHWADTWLNPDFFHWNILEELKHIKSPVLAVQGKQDEYGSPEQLSLIEKYSSALILLLDNCGHVPHFQQKEFILNKITKYLK